MMLKRAINWSFSFFFLFSLLFISLQVTALKNDASLQVIALKNDVSDARSLITKDRRRTVISTESGKVSAVEVRDGIRGAYRLQFITLEPNSLFLPALLHADMVLYVHTGNGSLNWVDEEEKKSQINVERGDIFSLPSGSVFSLSSSPESKGEEKLRIYAIFVNSNEESLHEPPARTYSTLSDLVLGFDKMTLQSSFKVPPELIEKITTATKPPSIVNVTSQDETDHLIWKPELNIRQLLKDISNKRKPKAFNILKATPDFQNCNGWSKMANRKDVPSLKHLNLGVFMVNLTKGSLMGPYWNPIATEIAIVVHGQGMVRIVCSSRTSDSDCKNKRFKVGEGDVFVVPPFHLTAQISFNNNSFVIMGFSTMAKKNHPEFLAGKRSMLRKLDRDILAKSMNVSTSTIDELLSSGDSMISDCTSCAEEEIQRERQERKGEQMKREQQEQEEETETEEEEEGHRREGEEEQRKREEQEAETEEEAERRQEQRQRRQGEEEEGGEQEQETETEEEGERRQEEKQRRQGKGEEGGGSEDE